MSEYYFFRKQAHPRNSQEAQGYEETSVSDTLNIFDNTETRTPILIVRKERDGEQKTTFKENAI
jgi:hypothetical protein